MVKLQNSTAAQELGKLPVSNSGKLCKIGKPRVYHCAKTLIAEYKKQYALSVGGEELTAGGEILVNEFYIVEKQIKLTFDAFEHIRMKGMPRFTVGNMRGEARVCALAGEFVRLNSGVVNVNGLTEFFEAYQQGNSLSTRETGMLKDMLRFKLLEYMQECLLSKLPEERRARDIRNILSSLKKLDDPDIDAAVSSLNMTDRILKQDEIYRVTDETSRKLYLNAAAKLACKLHVTETFIANTALRLAGEAKEKALTGYADTDTSELQIAGGVDIKPAEDAEGARKTVSRAGTTGQEGTGEKEEHSGGRRAHVGFYLVDDGIYEIIHALRPDRKRRRKLGTNKKLCFFIAAQLILTGALLIPAAHEGAVSFIFAVLPTVHIVNAAVISLCVRIIKPKPLVRLSADFGIAKASRTLVCVPILVTDEKTLRSAAETLEMHFLANRVENVEFALLADFADAKTKKTESDLKLRNCGEALIEALNKKYSPENSRKFHYLQRERVYNEHDGLFMGRERKRGAVAALIEFLSHGKRGEFSCVSPEFTEKFKYAVVLDSDTIMPDGALAKLVCTAAHPLNRPEYGASTRPRAGCGIIAPRMASTSRAAAESRFCALVSGDAGMSCYRVCVSDFYQDVFGEGNFGGKGIMDIEAFELALRGKIPDNAVLSHDMLEGCFAKAGFADDIVFYDGEPSKFRAWHKRAHRWLRGDFQLLPFLFGKLGKELNPLSKYKILENIVRGAAPVSIFAPLLISLITGRAVLYIYSLAAFFTDPAINLINLIINSFKEKVSIRPLILLIRRRLAEFAALPYTAAHSADSIIRALYRTAFSHKKMLEWQTAAADKAKNEMRFPDYCKLLLPCLLTGVLLPVFVVIFDIAGLNAPVLLKISAYMISVFWLLSPFIIRHLDGKEKRRSLSEHEKAELMRLFAGAWRYFEENCNEKTSFLPPDNFQEYPYKGAAALTSPTNIGMGLMAVVSARDMGFIDAKGMVFRLTKMLQTIEKAEKWNGHLFNWYGLGSNELSLLKPRFISTVDSGNLFVSLIVSAQALRETAADGAGEFTALAGKLAALAEKLAFDMDFICLYDKNRMLFHVGYEFDEGRLTESMYDLYASEARLTSFAAVAFSKIPSEHWFALSRLMCEASGGPALKSWSGTMFEYLMPLIFLETVPGSMQHEICRSAVLTQLLSTDRKTPWGMSESGYYAFDRALRYQYRAFGNAELALAPAHEKAEVIAPYATFLALAMEPKLALENLKLLGETGALGKFGMYEALDYTKSRVGNRSFETVKSFMAHHQGMTLCSINNCLNDNIIVRRFMNLPAVRAHEQLLFENMPVNPVKLRTYESNIYKERRRGNDASSYVRELSAPLGFSRSREIYPGGQFSGNALPNIRFSGNALPDIRFSGNTLPDDRLAMSALPDGQSLSNGNYTVFVFSDGSGFSKRGDTFLTRLGGFHGAEEGIGFAVKCGGSCRSVAGKCTAEPHKLTFTDRMGAVKLRLEILVSADFDCEIRKLTLINCGRNEEQTETGIFAAVSLAKRTEYESHPAFLKLNTDAEQSDDSIVFRLRKTPKRAERFAFFNILSQEKALLCADGLIQPGRLNSNASALRVPMRKTEASLPAEPYFSARIKNTLAPGESREIVLIAGMADSRRDALNIIKEQRLRLDGAEELVKAQAQGILRAFDMAPLTAIRAERLASLIVSDTLCKKTVPDFNIGLHGRKTLWKFGISGDRRFMAVSINSAGQRRYLKTYVDIQCFLRAKGINFDLIVIGEYPHEYANPVRAAAEEILRNTEGTALVHGYLLSNEEKVFLNAAALAAGTVDTLLPFIGNCKRLYSPNGNEHDEHIVQTGEPHINGAESEIPVSYKKTFLRNGDFARARNQLKNAAFKQIKNPLKNADSGEIAKAEIEKKIMGKPVNRRNPFPKKTEFRRLERKRLFDFNGYGGFDIERGEYVIYVNENTVTPLPWSNIIANDSFGTLVTESGGGYTWRNNSRLFRLTPWTNDAVLDEKQEQIYAGTDDDARVVPLTYAGNGEYEIRHGFGYSVFTCETEKARFILTETVDTVLPVKYYNIRILNKAPHNERHGEKFRIRLNVNWLLGDFPFASSVITGKTVWGVKAENLLSEYGETGFLALKCGGRLIEAVSGGLTAEVFSENGGNSETTFLLGCDRRENIENDIRKADFGLNMKKLSALNEKRLGGIKVFTPDARFDAIVNGRLLYQLYASRLSGRTGFYQSGGATGFRDQLQDVSALLMTDPERARNQLLSCASKQFEAGDVLHWWHENGAGVRTHITDDRLFLPFIASEYAETTGDFEIFGAVCPYLKAIPIPDGQSDLYTEFPEEGEGTFYEHCKKAIDISYALGAHGLPLMGGGDWNDGMDNVGADGGESVFLAFFLLLTTEKFIRVCEYAGDAAAAGKYRKAAEELRNNIEKHTWDNDRYIRAFFADGAKLGSADCTECAIDCVSECFAVFAGAKHAEEAFDTLLTLVDNENGLIKLLAPPFSGELPRKVGYIEGYIPGVRENGGQYTHAAAWCVIAACMLGRAETADRLFKFINPAEHGKEDGVERYKGEPYAVAGDIYSGGRLSGRAGWTWYTGAAGWLYRAATEYILGMKKRGNKLYLSPVTMMESFRIEYRYGKTTGTLYIIDARKTGKKKLTADGENRADKAGEPFIPLFDDGKTHYVYAEYL